MLVSLAQRVSIVLSVPSMGEAKNLYDCASGISVVSSWKLLTGFHEPRKSLAAGVVHPAMVKPTASSSGAAQRVRSKSGLITLHSQIWKGNGCKRRRFCGGLGLETARAEMRTSGVRWCL